MENKKRGKRFEELNVKNLILIFVIVLGIVLIFTAIDYYVHSLSEEYAVPSYYFRNKIIFGTGIGFIAYIFIRKLKWYYRSFVFSAIISILLQTRYFLEGYALKFVFEFMRFHFLMLLPVSMIVFKLLDKKLKGGSR